MKWNKYLKDKKYHILGQLLIIVPTVILLHLLNLSRDGILLIVTWFLLIEWLLFGYDYMRRRKYYDKLWDRVRGNQSMLPVVSDIEKEFADATEVTNMIETIAKTFNENMIRSSYDYEEYKEYVETWIHEVKTPIAAAKLICTNRQEEAADGLLAELDRIEFLVSQSLYYARSMNVEKDFLVQKVKLEELVNSGLRKNAGRLIKAKASIQKTNLDLEVKTDIKWMRFILDQILDNAIKYRREPLKIEFTAQEFDHQIILQMKDNGIGIAAKDVAKVFEKGFTGINGRKYQKATGIGLYLSRKLCHKLHHSITIDSVEGEYTRITIVFPMLDEFLE